MALLASEDREVPSWIRLELLAPASTPSGWVGYRLVLRSGDRELSLEDAPASSSHLGRCLLSGTEVDEIEQLCQAIERLLAQDSPAGIQFEPSEPNFTLEIRQETLGFSVWLWVDAGNQAHAHSTWDALGIRFFTHTEALRAFVLQLREEKGAHGQLALMNPGAPTPEEN